MTNSARWLVVALVCLPIACGDNAQRAGAEPVPAVSLESRMSVFVASLNAKDVPSFLTLFSPKGSWRYSGTLTKPSQITVIPFADLARDLKAKKGWYEVLFDAGGDDCFRDHIVNTEAKPWEKRGERTFYPPGSEPDALVHVRWRNENGTWVIDEIAEPAS